MIRKICTTVLLTIFGCAGIIGFAQSGRNKKLETAAPKVARPAIELPEATRASVLKTMPVPTATPPKTIEPETDDEVITVDSTLVPIPASITDQNGNAVANLKLEDFELRVGGQVQPITEVSRAETPVRLAMLFDNSSSVSVAREFEIEAATKFFKKVIRPARDQAALYSVSHPSQRVLKLTSDTKTLIRAIENFPPPAGATALFDAIVMAAHYLNESNDGRRVIVIVSDGADTISDITEFSQVLRETLLANCQVYVVKTTDFENLKRTGRRGGSANLFDPVADNRMKNLTAQTGGSVYAPLDERELDQAFARIAAELSEQYVLNYYPTDTKLDGSFKTIDLAVKSNKNLTVRTRKGYYVPKS